MKTPKRVIERWRVDESPTPHEFSSPKERERGAEGINLEDSSQTGTGGLPNRRDYDGWRLRSGRTLLLHQGSQGEDPGKKEK